MEHRWGRRLDTSIDASLFGHPCAVGRGCVRNLSMTGAFVQTNLRLPLLSQVDIELHLRLVPPCETHRIAASVVRTTGEGIGIEWCDPLAAQFVSLAAGQGVQSKPRLIGANVYVNYAP